MPTIIDSLIVELGLDPSKFNKETKDVSTRLAGFRRSTVQGAKDAEDSVKRISDAFDSMAKKLIGYVAGLITARAALGFAKDIVETNRTLGNLADVMQVNIQRLSALGNTFDRLGGSSDSVLGAIKSWDDELKGIEMTAGDPTQSRLIKFLNYLGTIAKISINPMDKTGKKFRDVTDIFIEVSDKLAKSPLDARTKALLLSPQASGLPPDVAAVILRGKVKEEVENQKKILATTEEQRKATDKLNTKWIELGQVAKRLGQEVLVDLAGGLEKVLNVTIRFVDWLSKEFNNPQSILFLPTIDKAKTLLGMRGKAYLGGVEGTQGVGWPRTVDGGAATGSASGNAVGGQGAMGGMVHGHAVDPYGGLSGEKLYEPMTGWMGGGVGGHSAMFGSGHHEGVDIMGRVGSPVYAMRSGTVIRAPTPGGGIDQVMIIDHGNGLYSRYLHQGPTKLKSGDRVEGGQVVGSSGFRNAAHTHFEIWKGKPGGSGSVLLNPKALFGWDKNRPAVGGREVIAGGPGQAAQQQASKSGGGGWPAPLTAVPFLNFKPIMMRKPNVSNTTRTEINSVTVNSQAADASGIAGDIREELRKQMREELPSQQFLRARTPQEADAAMSRAGQQ